MSVASRAEKNERARADRLATEADSRRSAARQTNLIRLGLILALALVAVAVAVAVSSRGGSSSSPSSKPADRAAQRQAVSGLFAGIPQKGTVLGDPRATYTLMEFADLQCPVCQRYTLDVLPSVIKGYVRPGKLRMDLKLRTFLGPDSKTAAGVAAAAAAQSRIWPFADAFYRNQGEENSGYVTPDFLRGIARDTPGLDATRALGDANASTAQSLIRSDEALANQLGSNETPDFYLRKGTSTRLVKVQPSDLTPAAFRQALARAMKLAS